MSGLPPLLFVAVVSVLAPVARAQQGEAIRPSQPAHSSAPTEVKAKDTPNDAGNSITVSWKDAADPTVATYEVLWAETPDAAAPVPAAAETPAAKQPPEPRARAATGRADAPGHPEPGKDPKRFWQSLGTVAAGTQVKTFDQARLDGTYYFRVVGVSADGQRFPSATAGPVSPQAQWFNSDKIWVFLLGLVICASVVFFIQWVKRGRQLFVRKIAGLEAIDEAIGRATEMGRPVVFVPGIMDMDNVQTLAGLTLLGHVAKSIAEYDTKLDVPVSRSLVMTTGREVVKQAYLQAGRADAYNDDMVHYLTDEQFGYVAGVNGIIVREQPATCVYMGAFYAESLILAETGNSMGAIQIAGTAMPAQLPFFVAACDYTLIGEELFAASAYLSGDAKQLGSLKGQDVGKALVMLAIAVGSGAATLGHLTGSAALQQMHEFILRIFA